MISNIFSKKRFWLVMVNLLVVSSVHAELMNVGPTDRLYEYLFFDGQIKSGTSELNIFSGINDNGTWKASTSVDNNWKTASTSAWQNAVEVYNPGEPKDILPSTQAKFIWAPNADDSNKAYFNYDFDLEKSLYFSDDGKFVGSASAKVLADDFFAMSVNGNFVKNGLLDTQIANNKANNGFGLPVDVDFSKWLKDGNNTISIFAYDGYKVEKNDLINSDTVKTDINTAIIPNKIDTLEISYSPSNNTIHDLQKITISDAADILGYDHFNWYQFGSNATYPGNPLPNCYPYGTPICTDPPINFLDIANSIWNPNSGSADTEPFYWDEFASETDKRSYLQHIVNNSFGFYDSPGSKYDESFILDTFLVGINEKKSSVNNGWTPLYHVSWKTNCSINGCSIEPNPVEDSETINLGNVTECMVNDGANISGATNLICFKKQDPCTLPNPTECPEPTELSLVFLGFLEMISFRNKLYKKQQYRA